MKKIEEWLTPQPATHQDLLLQFLQANTGESCSVQVCSSHWRNRLCYHGKSQSRKAAKQAANNPFILLAINQDVKKKCQIFFRNTPVQEKLLKKKGACKTKDDIYSLLTWTCKQGPKSNFSWSQSFGVNWKSCQIFNLDKLIIVWVILSGQ